MEGHLTMSHKELRRKSVLELVRDGRITLAEGSRRMGLSYRQTLRVYSRFTAEGDAGLVHRRRGRRSNRSYAAVFRAQVMTRYEEKYKPIEMGPTLAAEKLALDGLAVDHETLRRWMLEEGHWQLRRRRRAHRTRRERRAHFGELVQMDGSHHHWFGPQGDQACLLNMVDDATGITLGLMDQEETTEAAMRQLWRWIERFGIPVALYTDKKNVYIPSRGPTIEEQLADEAPKTAFGKACDKLGIEIIAAHSPQAKGRVERSNGTYQDRLVKELALQGITTCQDADQLLRTGFCEDLNAKFAVAPLKAQDYHRPVPKGLRLEDVFSFEAHRVLQNDWTIRYHNQYYQILEENRPLPKPKDKVLVRTRLDGTVHLLYRGKPLAFRPISVKEVHQQRQAKDKAPVSVSKSKNPPKPKKHWRPNVDRLAVLNERTR